MLPRGRSDVAIATLLHSRAALSPSTGLMRGNMTCAVNSGLFRNVLFGVRVCQALPSPSLWSFPQLKPEKFGKVRLIGQATIVRDLT
jgi:hypothetical protein